MSTTSNDKHWLYLITQCRSSGLSDRQWCIENGIPVSTVTYAKNQKSYMENYLLDGRCSPYSCQVE